MAQNKSKAAEQKAKEEARMKRADSFWNIFLFTKNGKVKSTLVVNSFSLSILYLAVYAAAYFFLIDPIEAVAAGVCPVWLTNVLESLIPGVLGTCVCVAPFFLFRDKRLVPVAYGWLVLYAAVTLIGVSIGLDAESRTIFFNLYAMLVPVPLLLGCAVSHRLFRLERIKNPAQDAPIVEKKPWEA